MSTNITPCICNSIPSVSINASITALPLWSTTINFNEKISLKDDIDYITESIKKTITSTKNVCSEKQVNKCKESCSTICKCITVGKKKKKRSVCGCVFGTEQICKSTCSTVPQTFCNSVDTITEFNEEVKLDVKTEVNFRLKGSVSINLYANTAVGAGTGGAGTGGAKVGTSIYLIIQINDINFEADGKLKVKDKHVASISIKQGADNKPSKSAFQKFEIPPITVGATLKFGIDINNLSSYTNIWDFIDGELAACVGFTQLSLNYDIGITKITLGNPAINLCANPILRKMVLSLKGSVEHSFNKIKNTNAVAKVSTDFLFPVTVPIT